MCVCVYIQLSVCACVHARVRRIKKASKEGRDALTLQFRGYRAVQNADAVDRGSVDVGRTSSRDRSGGRNAGVLAGERESRSFNFKKYVIEAHSASGL